jgi:hypothetical protein
MSIIDFDSGTWNDGEVLSYPPPVKLLFVYLWTNSHKNLAGLYELPMPTMRHETGLTEKQLRDGLAALYPKILFDPERNLVWVVNHVKHQFLRKGKVSPKIVQAVRKCLLADVPEGHPFIGEFLKKYKVLGIGYPYPTDTLSLPYGYPPGEGKGVGKGKVVGLSKPSSLQEDSKTLSASTPQEPEVEEVGFGEHVRMPREEHTGLVGYTFHGVTLTERGRDALIEELNDLAARMGKAAFARKYKAHHAVVRTWFRMRVNQGTWRAYGERKEEDEYAEYRRPSQGVEEALEARKRESRKKYETMMEEIYRENPEDPRITPEDRAWLEKRCAVK